MNVQQIYSGSNDALSANNTGESTGSTGSTGLTGFYSIIHIESLGDNKYQFGNITNTNFKSKRDLLKLLFEDPNYVYYIIEHIDDYMNDYSEEDLIDIMDTDDPLSIPLYEQLYIQLYQSSDNKVDEFFDKIEHTQYNPPIFFVQKHGSNSTFVEFCTNNTFEF